jgi:hypothetical protein
VKDKDKAQLDVCRGDLMAFQLLHPTPRKSQRLFFSVCINQKRQQIVTSSMVRFLVVKVNHLVPNPRFDVDVVCLRLIIISVVDDVSSTLRHFFTDFINLKIKLIQSFKCVHTITCACVYS